jgi:hypothetical protein
MSRLPINIGTTGNDATGDSIREAFRKTNANFTELYTSLGLGDRQKFTNLDDVPNGPDAYNDQAGKILAVNVAEAGLEFLRMEGAGGINVSTTSTPGSIVITNTRSSIITDTTPQLGGDLNAGNKKIYNLGDPTEPQDAMNLRSGLLKSGYTDEFPDNKMTGPLILNRDPIVSDDRNFNGLIAATKRYVDNSSFVSTVNFFVSTSGTDYRADLTEDKRGRAWAYAFNTVQRGCEAAEAVINATPLELGPYQKVLTYDGGQSEAAVISYVDQSGGIFNLSLFTDSLRTDFENDLRPGLYIQGDVSKALAKIVSIDPVLSSGNEIFVVTPVSGTFRAGEKVRYSDAVQATQITIFVESGIYTENFPIKLPPNTSIVGDEFRRAIIRPRDSVSASPWVASVFRRDKTFDGMRLTDYIGSNLASFTTATPSAASGTVTVALGSTVPANASQWIGGFFRAAQAGSTKFAEGLVTAVGSSSITVVMHDEFINLSAVAAGQWTIFQTSTYGRHYLTDITKPIYPVVNYGGHTNAARILTLNKAFIQAEVTAYLDYTFGNTTNTTSIDPAEFQRNVRLILDAVVSDMVLGSNYRSVAAGIAYANIISEEQKPQIISGINKAKQLTISAVSGNSDAVDALTIGFNNVIRIIIDGASVAPALDYPNPTGLSDPNRFAKVLLIANKTFIQKEITAWLGAGNAPIATPTGYSIVENERNIGYILDALVYDLTYNGNSRTIAQALAYVTGSSISENLVDQAGVLSTIPGQEAFIAAAYGRMKTVVQSISRDQTVSKTTTGTAPNAQNQVRKAALGITDALTDTTASTSLGLNLDNVIDVINSIDTTSPFTTPVTIPTAVYPTFTTGTAELRAAKVFIDAAQITISAGAANYLSTRYSGTFTYNRDKCARDVGIIVDAMAFDLTYSGGQRTIAASLTYYQAGAALVLSDQLFETTSAFEYLRELALTLITEPLVEIPEYLVVGSHVGYRYQSVVPQVFAVAESTIISFTSATKAITSSNVNVINFFDLGFRAGDTIIVTGTLNNDDSYTVVAVSESIITVLETLTDESSIGGSVFTITNDLTINAGSTAAVNSLTDSIIGIINNDANFNPPLRNDQLDVFLCNDAVMVRNVTFQGHGGFTMVFDPEGQIRTKSPYAQTCSSLSRSINSQIFAGGQFVDGFAGNVAAAVVTGSSSGSTALFTSTISGTTLTITNLISGTVFAGMSLSGGSVTAGTYIISGSGITWTLNQVATGTPSSGTSYTELAVTGLVRQPQVPCSFVIAGTTYSVSTINNYSNIDGSAVLNLSLHLPTARAEVITAGGFTVGLLYTINTLGDTDFTLVGAASNTVGLLFIATGVGSGTGTVYTTIELITAGNRSMLSNDYTQVNDLGYGLVATNNGLIEAVSVFTYYNYTAYYSLNGGQIRSLNGSCAYGINALKAEGSDPLEIPDDVTLKYDLVQTAKIYAPVTMTLSAAITGTATIGTVVTQATSGLTGTIVDINTGKTTIAVLPILPRVSGTVIGITGGSNTGTITSAGVGVVNFSTAGFTANQYITIYGTVSNDGSYKISGSPTSTGITLSQKFINGAWSSTFTTVTETAGTYLTVAVTGSFLNTASDTLAAPGWTNTPYPTTTGSDYATATAGLTIYVDTADYLPNNLSEIEIAFTGSLTRVYRYEVSSSSLVTAVIPTATTAGSFVVGIKYTIVALGTTTNAEWNTTAGTSSVNYIAGSVFTAATVGTGTGTATRNDTIANNATSVYKLNISAGSTSVGSTGLFSAVPHGQYVILRQNRTLWLDGLKEVVAVRPSTALVIADQPTSVYRVLSFTLVNSQTGTFVWSGTTATIAATAHGLVNGATILVSFSGGTYGNPATAAYVVTYIDVNSFSISIGSANGTGYDSLGAVAFSQSTGQGYANLREPYGSIIVNDYAVTGGVAYPASHGGKGDTQIACIGIGLNDIPRIVGMKFAWYDTVHTITEYLPPGVIGGTTDTGTVYGRLTFTPALTAPFQKLLGNYDSINAVRAVQIAGQTGNISVNISTMRATGHDMLSIGTGSFADSNYPNNIYGPPITSAASAKEVQEIGKGRVFYVSTDQDGNFKVGEFFKVDQGTGTVTFSASIALSNLNGLGFKRGVAISEFSTDDTLTDNAADTVPTEQAVRGYLEKRLGITHTGGLTPSSTLIPVGGGFVDRKGLLSMTGSLKMGGNVVTDLGTPSGSGDAVPYSWLTFGKLQDFDDNNIQSGDLLVMTGDGTRVTNANVVGPVTFNLTTGDSSTPQVRSVIGNGQITNTMFSSNSGDKLSLSKVEAIAKAATTSTFSDDTKKGLASFNSTQFSSADGFISFTGTVALSSIGAIAAYTLLGNNSPTASAPSAVAFTDVVTVGGALRKDTFTQTGVMTVASAPGGVATAFASSLQISSTNTASRLVQRDANGDFSAGTVTLGTRNGLGGLRLTDGGTDSPAYAEHNVLAFITSRITNTAGSHILKAWDGNDAIIMQSGSGYEKTLHRATEHQFRDKAGSGGGTITLGAGGILTLGSASTITIGTGSTLTTGGETVAANITGRWSLTGASRLEATYADLAEYYSSDKEYAVGWVMMFGGEAEVTAANINGTTKVAGVVSTDPAYIMNSALEGTRVCLALQGRVPCRVVGKIKKGDLIIASDILGVAVSAGENARAGTIIGKALADYDSDHIGLIEVAVGRV